MKTYVCRKIKENIHIDGNLDKPTWRDTEGVCLYDTVTGRTPKQKTTVKMLWNDEYLYVGFECHDDAIHATFTEYNTRLYEEEVVEIFIDDNNDLKTYIEIEVNPLNALLHYAIHNNLQGPILTFARTDRTVTTAVQHHEHKALWRVEISIPFHEFATSSNNPPHTGDKWLMNLYRIDRPRNGKHEYSAWSPTGKINYHLPEKFGELIFVEEYRIIIGSEIPKLM